MRTLGAGLQCAAACAPRKRKRAPVSGRLIRGVVLSPAAPVRSCFEAGHAFGRSLLGDPAGAAQFGQRSPVLPPRLAAAGRGEQWPRGASRDALLLCNNQPLTPECASPCLGVSAFSRLVWLFGEPLFRGALLWRFQCSPPGRSQAPLPLRVSEFTARLFRWEIQI